MALKKSTLTSQNYPAEYWVLHEYTVNHLRSIVQVSFGLYRDKSSFDLGYGPAEKFGFSFPLSEANPLVVSTAKGNIEIKAKTSLQHMDDAEIVP